LSRKVVTENKKPIVQYDLIRIDMLKNFLANLTILAIILNILEKYSLVMDVWRTSLWLVYSWPVIIDCYYVSFLARLRFARNEPVRVENIW